MYFHLIFNYHFKILFILISSFVGLIICEIALRVKHNLTYNYDIEMWKYAKTLKQKDVNPKISHTHIKNKSQLLQGVEVKINNYGQRDIDLNKNIIQKYGAVSHECCFAMVNNLSKISKANINVSITGIAGPNGGTKQKPVGLVYIGIRKDKKTQVHKCLFKSKKRSSIQKSTVKKALNLVFRVTK